MSIQKFRLSKRQNKKPENKKGINYRKAFYVAVNVAVISLNLLTPTKIHAENVNNIENADMLIRIGKDKVDIEEVYDISTKSYTYFKRDLVKIQSVETDLINRIQRSKISNLKITLKTPHEVIKENKSDKIKSPFLSMKIKRYEENAILQNKILIKGKGENIKDTVKINYTINSPYVSSPYRKFIKIPMKDDDMKINKLSLKVIVSPQIEDIKASFHGRNLKFDKASLSNKIATLSLKDVKDDATLNLSCENANANLEFIKRDKTAITFTYLYIFVSVLLLSTKYLFILKVKKSSKSRYEIDLKTDRIAYLENVKDENKIKAVKIMKEIAEKKIYLKDDILSTTNPYKSKKTKDELKREEDIILDNICKKKRKRFGKSQKNGLSYIKLLFLAIYTLINSFVVAKAKFEINVYFGILAVIMLSSILFTLSYTTDNISDKKTKKVINIISFICFIPAFLIMLNINTKLVMDSSHMMGTIKAETGMIISTISCIAYHLINFMSMNLKAINETNIIDRHEIEEYKKTIEYISENRIKLLNKKYYIEDSLYILKLLEIDTRKLRKFSEMIPVRKYSFGQVSKMNIDDLLNAFDDCYNIVYKKVKDHA